LETSDWVVVGTTLGAAVILGAFALFVPYFVEFLKRKWFSPKLSIEFELAPPFCHLTCWKLPNQETRPPVYYFTFSVKNTGRSAANDCEARLEELWIADSSGAFIKEDAFRPVNLFGEKNNRLSPGRSMFFNLGHISFPEHQREHEKSSSVKIDKNDERLRFTLDANSYFFQYDSLLPGNNDPQSYRLTIAIYCENSPGIEQVFELTWSGVWKETEEEMFREIVIRRL